MDSRTEALLGPERPQDPAEAQALERKVEEEDFALRVRLAGYATPLLLFFAIVLYPILHFLPQIPAGDRLFAWVWLNVPLIALATLTLRRGRLPLGRGRFLTGRPARRAALSMLAVSLILSLGLGVVQALWAWIAPAAW